MKTSTITIDKDLEDRITPLLRRSQRLSQFVLDATEEKVNRMEKSNERAKEQLFQKSVNEMLPIFEECAKKLGYSKDK